MRTQRGLLRRAAKAQGGCHAAPAQRLVPRPGLLLDRWPLLLLGVLLLLGGLHLR